MLMSTVWTTSNFLNGLPYMEVTLTGNEEMGNGTTAHIVWKHVQVNQSRCVHCKQALTGCLKTKKFNKVNYQNWKTILWGTGLWLDYDWTLCTQVWYWLVLFVVLYTDPTSHEKEKGSGYNTTSRPTLEVRNQMPLSKHVKSEKWQYHGMPFLRCAEYLTA